MADQSPIAPNTVTNTALVTEDANTLKSPKSPPPQQHNDWEVLSMSTMSASTLGFRPRPEGQPEIKGDSFLPPELQQSVNQSFYSSIRSDALTRSDESPLNTQPVSAPITCDIQEPFAGGKRHELRATEPSSLSTKHHEYQEGSVSPAGKEEPTRQDRNASGGEDGEMSASLRGDFERDLESGLFYDNEELDSDPNKCPSKTSWWEGACFWQSKPGKPKSLWSIIIVATLFGFAIVGYRWQRERYQNHQLKLELSAKEEKLNDLMNQVNRMMTGRRKPRSAFF